MSDTLYLLLSFHDLQIFLVHLHSVAIVRSPRGLPRRGHVWPTSRFLNQPRQFLDSSRSRRHGPILGLWSK